MLYANKEIFTRPKFVQEEYSACKGIFCESLAFRS